MSCDKSCIKEVKAYSSIRNECRFGDFKFLWNKCYMHKVTIGFLVWMFYIMLFLPFYSYLISRKIIGKYFYLQHDTSCPYVNCECFSLECWYLDKTRLKIFIISSIKYHMEEVMIICYFLVYKQTAELCYSVLVLMAVYITDIQCVIQLLSFITFIKC